MQQHVDMTVLGWREYVQLPEFLSVPFKAKIDSGAKTSALHAEEIRPFTKNEQEWVEFLLCADDNTPDILVSCVARVLTKKKVKSSNGQTEIRYTISSEICLGSRSLVTEITLTNRDAMGFNMLIGRSFLKHGFYVDCNKSFMQGRL